MGRRMHAFPAYKVAVPQVGEHVRRTRLLARVDEAIRRAPVTWVVGLPGSGKTSAVARWVREAKTPCCWYRLDETDGDVASWFAALASKSKRRAQLPVWSPENAVDLRAFSRRFFGELGHDAMTLVLDDCHRVPDESALLELLGQFHEFAGPLRVVVISRRAAPAPVARGLLGGWLSVVDDLRLAEGEALEIAEGLRGSRLTSTEAAALSKTDGWLAHVLALAHRRSANDVRGVDVGGYLADELLESLPVGHRAALRRLAELPEIPHRPLDAQLLPREVAGLLDTLTSQRYFVDVVTEGRWRLHDLLRDALLQRNHVEDDAATLRHVRRDLGAWVKDSSPEAAMALYARAQDAEAVWALLEAHGAAWFSSGLHRTVSGWLEQVPTEGHPALCLWKARALLPLEPERARPLFRQARRLAVDATVAANAWCGEVSSYVVQWGAVGGLADLVDELEALTQRFGPLPGDLALRTSADALTALMYGRAEDPRIWAYAEATAKMVAHAPDPGARISAAAQLLIYKLWWAGDFPGGRVLYDTFDAEVSSSTQLEALPKLLWWSCASIIDWQCGSAEACYSKVERGLALADSSGVHVRDFFLLTQGIFCALSQEDWPRAERYLEQLARTERTYKRLDTMVHHFFRSWYALCRNDHALALAHAETAWPIAEEMGSMFHKVIVLSALVPARVARGDLNGAEEAYRVQLSLAKAAGNPTFSFIAFCGGAELALARNDPHAIKKQVDRMLQVKDLAGFHSHCGWRTSMMQAVLGYALRHGIHPEVAKRWVREKRIPPPSPAPAGWPTRVQVFATQGLVVKIDGAEDVDGGRSAQKLRELLGILVAQREGITQGELFDELWPDSDGDRAAASLKVAIHRLRGWLGSEAVRVKDGIVRLDSNVVDCDVWHVGQVADSSRVLYGLDHAPVQRLRAKLVESR